MGSRTWLRATPQSESSRDPRNSLQTEAVVEAGAEGESSRDSRNGLQKEVLVAQAAAEAEDVPAAGAVPLARAEAAAGPVVEAAGAGPLARAEAAVGPAGPIVEAAGARPLARAEAAVGAAGLVGPVVQAAGAGPLARAGAAVSLVGPVFALEATGFEPPARAAPAATLRNRFAAARPAAPGGTHEGCQPRCAPDTVLNAIYTKPGFSTEWPSPPRMAMFFSLYL